MWRNGRPLAAAWAVAALLGACGRRAPVTSVGDGAPDFGATTLAGESLSLSGLKGKVVLLDFWATWCGPCEESIPHLVELYGRDRPRGLEIVGISVDDEPADVPPYVRSHGMRYPILVDQEKSVMDLYGVRSIPTTVLLDRQGRIRARWLGAGPDVENELDAAVVKLLDEKS